MHRQRCRTAVRGRSRTRARRGVVTAVRPNPDWQRERSRPKSRCFSRLLVVRHFSRPEGEIWGGDRAPPNTPELGYRNPAVSSCLPELVQKLERAAELQLELPGSPGSSRSGSPGSFRSVSPPSAPESPLRSPPPAPPSGPLRPLPSPPRQPPFLAGMPLEPPLLPGAVPLPLPPPVLPPIARPAPPGPAWGSPTRRARREAEMSDEEEEEVETAPPAGERKEEEEEVETAPPAGERKELEEVQSAPPVRQKKKKRRWCIFLNSLICVSVETDDQDEPMEAAETVGQERKSEGEEEQAAGKDKKRKKRCRFLSWFCAS